jgi:hypothetical protein
MSTTERYPKGTQFFTNATPFVPLAGGKLLYYVAGTNTPATTYADADGVTPSTVDGGGAIVLNSVGRLTEAVYLSSANDYKELLTTSGDVTVSPWPEDDIPAAPSAAAAVTSAAPRLPWVNVSSSTVLDAEDFSGLSLLVDDSGATRTITLPSAVATGNGYAGVIAKGSASNTTVINTQGGQTINGASSYTLTAQYQAVVLVPDGANWKIIAELLPDGSISAARFAATMITALTALTSLDRDQDFILIWDQSASAFKKCSPKFFDSREPDSLHSLSVADKDLTTPPVSPSEGGRYIVASGATGAWSGQDGKVASYFNAAWAFYAPAEGWFAWVADEDLLYRYTGTAWVVDEINHIDLGITPGFGAFCKLRFILQSTTLAGATTDAATAIPIGTVLAVSCRVTTLITASGGGASFSVGDGSTANKFGGSLPFTLGTTNRGHVGPTGYYSGTDPVRFTVNTGAFTAGAVRSVIWYLEFTPPTS